MEQILKFAKKSGAEGAEYVTKWHDFDVYAPTYKDGQMPVIGQPQFILVSGKTMKWASMDEAFEIIDNEIAKEANK